VIRIERPPDGPPILRSRAAAREHRAAAAYYRPKRRRRDARPPELTIARHSEVREALVELFQAKCAYCETPMTEAAPYDVEHHRPKARAMGLDGQVSEEHYYWLADEWTNLLLICADCSRSKGTRFPVQGTRAEPMSFGTALLAEQALLLDPTVDDPEEHLVFAEDGSVLSETDRGKSTIEVLSLNRSSLIQARRSAFLDLSAQLQASEQTFGAIGTSTSAADAKVLLAGISGLLAPAQPYAALHRQFITRWFESGVDMGDLERRARPVRREAARKARLVTKEQEEVAAEEFRKYAMRQQDYSVERDDSVNVEAFYAGKKSIEWVELVNFKAIDRLELAFPKPASEREPWLMLLGENGTGKSSLLQALALALMGEEHCRNLALDASRYVRVDAPRNHGGRVRVKLTNIPEPIEVRFKRSSTDFEFRTPDPKVLLLGYGATRILQPRARAAPTGPQHVRIKNLFDPTAPLSDVESWLLDRDLVADDRFLAVEEAFLRLLVLMPNDRIVREFEGVNAVLHGHPPVQLRQLSDGFQSVVALSADIMKSLFERFSRMAEAEGIVLVDELEAHLHPTWKIEIVERLRQTFPRVSFIASTHDPLCLKGLQMGEIVVLSRDAQERIVAETDVPPVNDLRADQILTSFLFGLPTTRGDDATKAIGRYAELSEKERRSETEDAELAGLRQRLDDTLTIAETPVQRRVEQAVLETLASMPAPVSLPSAAQPDQSAEEYELRRQLNELLAPPS